MEIAEAVVVLPGESRGRLDIALKAGPTETKGAYSIRVSGPMEPGRWVDEHIHHQEEEAWYVLRGRLEFKVAGKSLQAPAGTFVLVPRGTVHGFGNPGAEPAVFVEIFSPPGMENYFEERLELAQTTQAS